ncbi:MAG: hypothetical protein WAL67_13765 [Candidatus Cybelea sp.]
MTVSFRDLLAPYPANGKSRLTLAGIGLSNGGVYIARLFSEGIGGTRCTG